MTSVSITFTPLYGVTALSPLCYLLEIDDVCVLLDCGWDDKLNTAVLEPLRDVIPRLKAVLISHADIAHLGALPYAVGKLGLNCPIYMTFPVFRMGQMFMYDLYQSKYNERDFDTFTLDDVDKAFKMVTHLRYSQQQLVHGVTVTPFAAGHMIGGAVWRLVKETEVVVYAVDINLRKDHHLNGTDQAEFSKPAKPSLLILDSRHARSPPAERNSEERVLSLVVATLRSGGNVLLPVDTAGRCLELLLALERHWAQHKLPYPVALLNNVSSNTVDFASRLVEWMSTAITKQFDTMRANPFDFKFVQMLQDISELEELKGPQVVLATFPSMNAGFSKELFMKWADNRRNLILFTGRPDAGSLASQLLSRPSSIAVAGSRRVPLTGRDLEMYKERKRQERAEAQRAKKLQEEEALLLATLGDEESDDDSGDEAGGRGKLGFGRFTARYPMFPADDRKITMTDYGEDIDPADFSGALIGGLAAKSSTSARLRAKNDATDADGDVSMKPDGGAGAGAGAGSGEGDASGDVGMTEEVPTKVVGFAERVTVACRIGWVDMEGNTDGVALKNLLGAVKPHQVVLVHGSAHCRQELIKFCKASVCPGVFAPNKGECLDMSSGTSIFRATLRDSLYQSLAFREVGSYEVAWIDADMDVVKGSDSTALVPAAADGADHHAPVLLRKGGVQLKALKDTLDERDMAAKFRGRSITRELVAGDDTVVVRRQAAPKMEVAGVAVKVSKPPANAMHIEGVLGEDFFKVRDVLYDSYIWV